MKKFLSIVSLGLIGLTSSASAALTMPTPDYTDFHSIVGFYLGIAVAVLLGGYIVKRFFRV